MHNKKNKKKTLTISSTFNMKINLDTPVRSQKKTFIVPKNKNSKFPAKPKIWTNQQQNRDVAVKIKFNRKFVEQQATKRFIHS